MINPFRKQQEQKSKNELKQQTDLDYSFGLSTSQASAMEDQQVLDKREVLIQLSQWQQDRTDAMQKLFLKLCGYFFNSEKKILEKIKWDKGFVSIFGAQKLINYIEPLDRNVMLACWDDNTLIKTVRDGIAHPLRRFIFQNHKEISLKLEHAEYVFWIIINTVEPTYWRGYKDGERKKDREIIKVQELRNPYFQQKKKGVFGLET